MKYSMKPTLQGILERRWVRFGIAKAPVTGCSILFLLFLRWIGFETFEATAINTAVAQTCDFFLQRKWVFREERKDIRTFSIQAAKFAVGVVVIGMVEGASAHYTQIVTGLTGNTWYENLAVYVIAHIPIFFIRLAWEQYYVFKK